MIQGKKNCSKKLCKTGVILYFQRRRNAGGNMLKFVEGWLVETKDGVCYRLLILHGHYVGILNTLKLYRCPWYAIKTTGLAGDEKEILESIGEDNIVTVPCTISPETEGEDEGLSSFRVVDKSGNILFSSEEIRVFQTRIYQI
jgi:hypothetical protein